MTSTMDLPQVPSQLYREVEASTLCPLPPYKEGRSPL